MEECDRLLQRATVVIVRIVKASSVTIIVKQMWQRKNGLYKNFLWTLSCRFRIYSEPNYNIFETNSKALKAIHLFFVKSGNMVPIIEFQVLRGFVSIRDWRIDDRPVKPKMTECWMFANHPQGCPISEDACKFIHQPVPPAWLLYLFHEFLIIDCRKFFM